MADKNRSVLITGAVGRIGSLLMTELAKQGWIVRGCDIKPSKNVVIADITELSEMKAAMQGCFAIVHLAGVPNSNSGWSVINRLNIHGTRTVLEAARQTGVSRVVYASSIHTVGALSADTKLLPDLLSSPSGIYGVSKLAGENLCKVYSMKSDIKTTAVRICSFRKQPENVRELRTWFGFKDAVQLFNCCLLDKTSGYQMLWGVSANSRLSISDPVAQRIGYSPRQNAEDYVDHLKTVGLNVNGAGEWDLMGGPVADERRVDFS